MIYMSHNIRVDSETKELFDQALIEYQAKEKRKFTHSEFIKEMLEKFEKVLVTA